MSPRQEAISPKNELVNLAIHELEGLDELAGYEVEENDFDQSDEDHNNKEDNRPTYPALYQMVLD
ncbi:hypothetical protein [Streptococcus suis]|uniref:hypothetical protein n=1 Tax=Streptococcus suis TaxID=1307 RepID=UPI000C197634|nr:hypothetical protein [Streptococcus suis]